jgi:hypothetical protein
MKSNVSNGKLEESDALFSEEKSPWGSSDPYHWNI